MSKRIVISIALVVIGVGILFYVQDPQTQEVVTRQRTDSAMVKQLVPVKPAVIGGKQALTLPKEARGEEFEKIATWAGTEIDGELKVDQRGHLVIDRELRDFFDYMLSAVGELEPDAVFEIMSAYAQQQLPAPAVEQLMALLDDYLAFKESAQALRSTPLVAHAAQSPAYHYKILRETLESLKLLRRTHMSSEAVTAFFADEEAYAEYSIERMRITQADNLSAQQKQQQLDALVWQLPQGLQQSLLHKQNYQNSVKQTEAIMNSNLSEQETRQQLALLHPEAMTDRIMKHQTQKANLRQRFDEYQQEQQLLLSRQASEAEQQALLLRYFPTAQEQTIARTFTRTSKAQ